MAGRGNIMGQFKINTEFHKSSVEERLELGNKLVVGCIKCMDVGIVTNNEELSKWFDVNADHIACKLCGPRYGVAIIVGDVTDKDNVLVSFKAWMQSLAVLAGVERGKA